MLHTYGIKELYSLALAEGEGMGTAYEYFAKRLLLDPWLTKLPERPRTMLVAGLPQKYGLSLDAILLATELGVQLTVADDRPDILDRLREVLELPEDVVGVHLQPPTDYIVGNMSDLAAVDADFDLVMTSEVIQRLDEAARQTFFHRLDMAGRNAAVFTPNADNPAHTTHSGLSGLHLDELNSLFDDSTFTGKTGYVDMPPFPPGITRSDDQREQATQGRAEALAMLGLQQYARMERLIPRTVRQKQSHIVYALMSS